MENKIYLVGGEYYKTAVFTEADAEELYMDLVMDILHANFHYYIHDLDRSEEDAWEWVRGPLPCGGIYIESYPVLEVR